ncbi:G-protein coupled receptor 55 [Amia ocellicauda]|uniref:G-protein coupled receptor 55 n=1 Tax=Amia ocellicauda TaxID=2972642 RepID=UPI0034645C17
MSNCSFKEVNDFMSSIYLVIYIPTFVVGLILNSLALVVFCVMLKKWTESTIYMTNLALMDLLLLLPLPFKMHASMNKWSSDKKTACSFLESLYFVSMYGSIFTIMCISVDRYIGIKHPFKAKVLRSPKKALIVCIVIWVAVWAGTAPVYGFHSEQEPGADVFRCFHGFSKDSWSIPVILNLEIIGFLIPMLVMVFCTIQIIITLKKSEQNRENSQAGIRIIYANLFVFLVSFTPSHLGIFLQFLVRRDFIEDCSSKLNISLFVQVTMCLANVTCCLDAICYYFITKEIRSTSGSFRRSRSHRINSTTTEV